MGTQAVLNVLADERYKTITTEVKRYLQGHYGAAPGAVDEELRRRAIGAEAPITSRPPISSRRARHSARRNRRPRRE